MFEFYRFVLINGWLLQLLYMSFHIANSNCLAQSSGQDRDLHLQLHFDLQLYLQLVLQLYVHLLLLAVGVLVIVFLLV